MEIRLHHGLPFVGGTLSYGERTVRLEHPLLDSGSSGTLFSADRLYQIGVLMESSDLMQRIHGVGGTEFVFMKTVDEVTVGDLRVANFLIEIGEMDYGFEIDGIIGMNFLRDVGAIIDFEQLQMYSMRKT